MHEAIHSSYIVTTVQASRFCNVMWQSVVHLDWIKWLYSRISFLDYLSELVILGADWWTLIFSRRKPQFNQYCIYTVYRYQDIRDIDWVVLIVLKCWKVAKPKATELPVSDDDWVQLVRSQCQHCKGFVWQHLLDWPTLYNGKVHGAQIYIVLVCIKNTCTSIHSCKHLMSHVRATMCILYIHMGHQLPITFTSTIRYKKNK